MESIHVEIRNCISLFSNLPSVLDITTDRYTVQWEDPSTQKKSPQYRHMYGDKKKARLKPENIKMCGNVPPSDPEPPSEPETESEPEEDVPKQKKSRRARRQAAKKRQQQGIPEAATQETTNPDFVGWDSVNFGKKASASADKGYSKETKLEDRPRPGSQSTISFGGAKNSQANADKGLDKGPTCPTFGTSSTFSFGGAKDSKENGEKDSPIFGSSSTFTFDNDTKKVEEKKAFSFGTSKPEQEKSESIAKEKKADETPMKASKEQAKPTHSGNTSKQPETTTHTKKAASNDAQPKPLSQAKKSSYDKTMDQFERLAKELGDKVDLSDDIIPNFFPNDGTQYTQHKVKCPKNKKPGDFLEFTNPHIKGQKQRVQIPVDAKPGKFFKVAVPLPKKAEEETITYCACCLVIVKTKDRHDVSKAEDLGVSLRVCAHYCCETCFPTVGKMCPTCKTPLPKIESLDHLPYIQDFDNPSDAVKKALLENYFASKEADRLGTKVAKDALDESSQAATKAIDKHYRRASLKVHPDRFGETYRKEFNALTKARDVFRNVELRLKYLKEMLDIVCRVDVAYVPQSHQVWVAKNDPDAQEQAKSTPAPGGAGAEAPLQLDGGVAFSRPKRPRVFIQSEKARRVKLYFPLANEYQFLEYCQKIIIYGSCGKKTGRPRLRILH
jgi:hypothetical protein